MFVYASIARSWQMQEGPAKGIWKIAAIESVGAFERVLIFVFSWGQTKF